MKKIPSIENGMRTPTFEKKSQTQIFFFFFFGCFCRKFCHADLNFREQHAILLKKVENFRPKLRFPVFWRKVWPNFVTPFSTFANTKGSLPTKSTMPDRLRCRARPLDEDFTTVF
tara:strand:+ start:86 stop:430 length:345 start_codon:yes stop_codon:yes gene_type:complete